MARFTLTCCSTADMPAEYFKQRDIPYVCFHYILDGKEYPDDLGKTISFEEFYRRIDAGAMPTTSQVTVGQYLEFFEPMLQAGQDVLHLTLSSGISGAYGSAVIARGQLREKYPQRKLIIVDSLGASSGYGLLVDAAADLRDRGEEIETAQSWLEKQRLTIHHWFFSTDLAHYKRGGRISAAAAVMGSLLSICPLMNMDNEGRLTPRRKIRSKSRVIEEIVREMETRAENRLYYSGKCFISQSACYDDARQVADLVESRFPNLDGPVQINSVGTVIGAHTGPGTVALFFVGDERVD